MFANWLPFGVAYQNEFNGLRYAASVHHAETPGETVVGLGLGRSYDRWTLSGAIEIVDEAVSAKAQVVGTFGNVEGGVGYFMPNGTQGSDLAELFATVEAYENLSVTGVAQAPTDGGSLTGGFSARYSVSDSTALSLGVATDAGSTPVYSAFVDFRF